MSNTDTKYQISSFAAPTAEDIAYFDSLSDEEKRKIAIAELDKSADTSKAKTLTAKLKNEIFSRAMNRLADRYVTR